MAQFLESLGISHKDTFETYIGVRSVEVKVWARDESGHRYRSPDGETAAQHKISIPYVGLWEIPVNAAAHGETECTSRLIGSSGHILCERLAGHPDEHGANVDGVTHKW